MIPSILEFFQDKAVFMRAIKTLLVFLGIGIAQGGIPTGFEHGDKIGVWIAAASVMIGRSDKATVATVVEQTTAEPVKP